MHRLCQVRNVGDAAQHVADVRRGHKLCPAAEHPFESLRHARMPTLSFCTKSSTFQWTLPALQDGRDDVHAMAGLLQWVFQSAAQGHCKLPTEQYWRPPASGFSEQSLWKQRKAYFQIKPLIGGESNVPQCGASALRQHLHGYDHAVMLRHRHDDLQHHTISSAIVFVHEWPASRWMQ